MRKMFSAAVAALALTLSAPAAAAIVVTDYSFTANTVGGLPTAQSGTFSVAYNDANPSAPFTLTGLNLTIGSTLFTTANTWVLQSPGGFNIAGGFQFQGFSVLEGTDDFTLSFVTSGGQLVPYFFESTRAGLTGIGSSDVAHGLAVTQLTGAVPEPATWAMMILGFGGIGFAMRRRRKPALLSQVA
jgi:hypothetical protein